MSGIKPWAVGPFEMLYHAETHFLKGEDFDRRIALISFDNAIEVAITTYLALHPIQRGQRQYQRTDIETWQRNYHTKLDFFYQEVGNRSLPELVEKADIIFYHQNRNDQYHNGGAGVPELHKLEGIRQAAIWIFSTLFDVTDTDTILREKVEAAKRDENPHIRELEKDRAIDSEHGMTDIAGISYYTSEILFNVDFQAYKEIGEELLSLQEPDEENTEDS
ncbi:MAG: hypothetical protein P1R58_08045 [bacterium]|nr:hypothetical protein [bacterium]